MREDLVQRQVHAELRADAHRETNREQRVATESEEVVEHADLRDAEHRLPDRCDARFGLRPRRSYLAARKLRFPGIIGHGQCPAIKLAADRHRQRVEPHQHHRNGRSRQPTGQILAHLLAIERHAVGRHHMRDQLQPAIRAEPLRGDRGRLDRGVATQRRLDLLGLHALTQDLDLVVRAPQKLDLAVNRVPAEVPGAVQPVTRFAPRIGHEHRRGRLRPPHIPAADAGTADHHFADRARRHKLEVVIDEVHARGPVRPTDHRRLVRTEVRERRVHRGFGRAVGVVRGDSRPGPQRLPQVRRARLAADRDEARRMRGVEQPGLDHQLHLRRGRADDVQRRLSALRPLDEMTRVASPPNR